MKRAILLLSLMASTASFSQDDCRYSKNEVDEFTGNKTVVTEWEPFIQHTDSALKKYYKKEDYLTADVMGASVSETQAFYVRYKILSDEAYKYFGSISTEAKLILKFSDGETLTLNAAKYDTGDTNYDMDYTFYATYYLLTDDEMEIISTKPIEKVRMYWSKGYEDYECDNPESVLKVMNCVK